MDIIVVPIDTPEKKLFYDAREKLNMCVTAGFHYAYAYYYEQTVNVRYVQKQIIRYLNEGRLPKCCSEWALDVLAERIHKGEEVLSLTGC